MTAPITGRNFIRSHPAPPKSPASTPLDVLSGAVAGAVGVWVMDRVENFLYNREDRDAIARELQAREGGNDVGFRGAEKEALDRQPRTRVAAGKDVAHVAAQKLVRLAGSRMHTRQPNRTGVLFHYAAGILPGALYGALRRHVPTLQSGSGALYGLGLFIVNEEVVAPSLGLASEPEDYPWQAHARGAVAHVVLGVVTECLLRFADRHLRDGKVTTRR